MLLAGINLNTRLVNLKAFERSYAIGAGLLRFKFPPNQRFTKNRKICESSYERGALIG